MKKILTGKWLFLNNKIREDDVCKKIHSITNRSKKIANSKDGWDILYFDKQSNIYWELTYPNNESHGAGAPKLTELSIEDAKNKYNI